MRPPARALTMNQPLALLIPIFALLPRLVEAYSFQFTNTPTQCENLSVEITGSGGTPPYSLLLIPFGPPPFANNTEVRRIVNQSFDNGSTTLSLPLNFPENSQFVAIVSDSTGFATGGTSGAVTVQSSSNTGCYDAAQSVSPAFVFNIFPLFQIVQCQSTRFWWDNSNGTIHGTPQFHGVIPGGQSFAIPTGQITDVSGQGTGFNWTPSLRGGTTLMIVCGDDTGIGVAGSSFYIVSSSDDGSCLSDNSPSSTPGSPAGGAYPTSTDGSGTGSDSSNGDDSSGGGTPVGAIAGGIVGGVGALLIATLIIVFYLRRRRSKRVEKERPALFTDNDDDAPGSRRDNLPQYYEPQPFTLPEPTDGGESRPSTDRRQSNLTYSTDPPGGAGTPDNTIVTGTSRKSPMPPSLRPVNIVQHEDAGPSVAPENQEPETVELPPAYTNIRSTPAA